MVTSYDDLFGLVMAPTSVRSTYRKGGGITLARKGGAVQRVAVVEHEGATLIYGNGYVMFSTVPGETCTRNR
jgi:hypothetical protein